MLYVLKKRSEFLKVSSYRISYRLPSVIVQVAPSFLEHVRFGFTASRRTGKAVARNRSKRRLRALASLYPIKKPVDIVVIATPLTPTCSFQELSYDFQKATYMALEKLRKMPTSSMSEDAELT